MVLNPEIILYYHRKDDDTDSSYGRIRWLHHINSKLFRGCYIERPDMTFVISYDDVIPDKNQEISLRESP